MAAITRPPTYTNSSVSSTISSSNSVPLSRCPTCLYLYLNPAIATWNGAATFSNLATKQIVFDPNFNTTSTSILGCNTTVLTDYNTVTNLVSYTVDASCNLVAGFPGYPGFISATLTESSGTYLHLGTSASIAGGITTVDSLGSPICSVAWSTTNTEGIGTYSGRLTTKGSYTSGITITNYVTNTTGGQTSVFTSVDTFLPDDFFWVLPDLSSELPDLAAASQCHYILPGSVPNKLTAANYLTQYSTKPLSQAVTISTSSAPSSSASPAMPGNGASGDTSGQPQNTGSAQSSSQTADQTSDVFVPPAAGGSSTSPTPGGIGSASSSPTGAPTAVSSSGLAGDTPIDFSETSSLQPASISATSAPVQGQGASAGGQNPSTIGRTTPESTASLSGGPESIAAIGSGDSIASAIVSGLGGLGRSTPGLASVSPISNGPATRETTEVGGVVVGGDQTASAGGPAVTSDGAVITVLPGGGAQIVSGDVTRTVFIGASGGSTGLATTIAGLELSAVQATQPAPGVVLGGSITASAGGPAITSDGAVITVLPSEGGVQIISGGVTRTVLIGASGGSATTMSGLPLSVVKATQPVGSVLGVTQGFVLDATATITAGGSAAVISGTTYSALSSGSGILVVAVGQSITVTSLPPISSTGAASSQSVVAYTGAASIVRPTSGWGGIARFALAFWLISLAFQL